jgi:hypothetical protein
MLPSESEIRVIMDSEGGGVPLHDFFEQMGCP